MSPQAITIDGMTVHLTHWGAFEAVSDGERLTEVRPWRGDPEPVPLIGNVASAQHHPARITWPYVRKGWLGQRRTFHHAQSQVHRFLNCLGGDVRHVNSYSLGTSSVLLPYVIADVNVLLTRATAKSVVAEHSELMVAFGGLSPKNAAVSPGGVGGWGASASAVDLDDGGGGGLDGQADSRARVGGQGAPFAVPGGVAGDRGAAERGPRPPGVSRLPAGESHDLRTPHPRAGRDDRDGGIRRARAVCLVDDREVILARRADAVGGQVDAVRVVDLGGLDLPRRAEGERFDAVSLRVDHIAVAAGGIGHDCGSAEHPPVVEIHAGGAVGCPPVQV